MFTLNSQKLGQAAAMTFLAVVGVTAVTLSTPASATNGRTAVGMCIDSTASGARCGWSVSKDGSIDICNKNGCVTCPSADAQCVAAARALKGPVVTRPIGRGVLQDRAR
jgi:hypothetical protein